MHPPLPQSCGGVSHLRRLRRHQGDSIQRLEVDRRKQAGDLVRLFAHRAPIAHLDELAREDLPRLLDARDHRLEELIAVLRQEVLEPIGPPPGQVGGRQVPHKADARDRLVHRIDRRLAHPRSAIQHAVDRRQADPRGSGKILGRGAHSLCPTAICLWSVSRLRRRISTALRCAPQILIAMRYAPHVRKLANESLRGRRGVATGGDRHAKILGPYRRHRRPRGGRRREGRGPDALLGGLGPGKCAR